jgi:hypothetical protein
MSLLITLLHERIKHVTISPFTYAITNKSTLIGSHRYKFFFARGVRDVIHNTCQDCHVANSSVELENVRGVVTAEVEADCRISELASVCLHVLRCYRLPTF